MIIKYKNKYLRQRAYSHESGGVLFELTPIREKATWYNTVEEVNEAVELTGLEINNIVYVEVTF